MLFKVQCTLIKTTVNVPVLAKCPGQDANYQPIKQHKSITFITIYSLLIKTHASKVVKYIHIKNKQINS